MQKNKLIIMTNILLLLVLIFNSCSNEELMLHQKRASIGEKITEDIAKVVALNFYNRTYKSKINKQDISIASIKSIKDFNNNNAIYSININPSGYVLVSSNSKNIPIVAHSKTGVFKFDENSPNGLKGWIAENILLNNLLEKREPVKEIEWQWYYLSSARMPYPGDEDESEGDSNHTVKYSHTVNKQIGPLLHTSWGQINPYNYYIRPNQFTGCVAVATAQVMRYHKFPDTYDWSIMPNSANIFWEESPGILEISLLMKEVGDKINMNYTSNGSFAQTEDVIPALVNDYGYSNSATYSSYNFNKVKYEIKNYRPVIMDGFQDFEVSGWFNQNTTFLIGHAWVCDGYKEQYDVYIHNEGTPYEYTQNENKYEWLHMNWGYRGVGNGWFFKNSVIINDINLEIDGTSMNYQFGRRCIYKIKP